MTALVFRLRHRARCYRERLDLYSRDRWTNAQLDEFETAIKWGVLVFVAVLLAVMRIGG